MKKNFVLGLFLLTLLFTVTGCGKGTSTDEKESGVPLKDRKNISCVKKGIEKKGSDSYGDYKQDITFTAKMDDDKKLTYYSQVSHYIYNSEGDCNYWCDIKTDWNNEINAKNYKGGHRETVCACNKKTLDEKYIYDDIPNLASILRSDIRQLNDDNTFDVESWLESKQKYEYKCN